MRHKLSSPFNVLTMQPKTVNQPINTRIGILLGWTLKLTVVGSIALMIGFYYPTTVQAAELPPSPNAATLFEMHCAGCHPGGNNIIRRGKTLKQRALQRHGYTSQSAIAQLITEGKSLMSGYAERLSTEDIDSLAQYVLDQAAQGWR